MRLLNIVSLALIIERTLALGLINNKAYLSRNEITSDAYCSNELNISITTGLKPQGTPWISNIIASGMIHYFPYGKNSSGLCSEQGHLVQLYSYNYTLWALKMLDSYSKGPTGLIYGNVFDYGHYDQCVSTQALNNTLKGQFVMIALQFRPSEPIDEFEFANFGVQHEFLQPDHSFWNLVEYSKTSGDQRVRDRNQVYWAICVPSSCTEEDIEYSLNRTLIPLLNKHGLQGNLTVLESFTQSSNSISQHLLSTAPIIFTSIIIVLSLVILVSTIYQWMFVGDTSKYLNKFDWTMQKLSALYNLNGLLNTKDKMADISGIKVLSMFLIIFGHRMLITMFSPIHNSYENEIMTNELLNMIYMSGLLIVDTFLVVTGFLSFNKMLKIIDSSNSINPFKLIYRRYVRFTPTYAMVLGFTIWIYPYLESGPMPHTVIWNSTTCSTYWWTHLIYLNNYIYPHHQCLIQSWYLATDMQLYVLCCSVAYIWHKFGKSVGMTALLFVFILSVTVPAIRLVMTGYKGVTLLFLSDFASYYQSDEFIETYLQTHFRASPYIIGMVASIIYRKVEKLNLIKLKNKLKHILLLLTLVHLASMVVTLLSAWWFYMPGAQYTLAASILYNVLHRLGWAIPIAWIIIINSSNLSAPFTKIISFSAFGPLNQIGYSVFLIHTLFQLYLAGLSRAPVYYNWLTSWWMAAGDVVLSYGLALILYLTVEAPSLNLFVN